MKLVEHLGIFILHPFITKTYATNHRLVCTTNVAKGKVSIADQSPSFNKDQWTVHGYFSCTDAIQKWTVHGYFTCTYCKTSKSFAIFSTKRCKYENYKGWSSRSHYCPRSLISSRVWETIRNPDWGTYAIFGDNKYFGLKRLTTMKVYLGECLRIYILFW